MGDSAEKCPTNKGSALRADHNQRIPLLLSYSVDLPFCRPRRDSRLHDEPVSFEHLLLPLDRFGLDGSHIREDLRSNLLVVWALQQQQALHSEVLEKA